MVLSILIMVTTVCIFLVVGRSHFYLEFLPPPPPPERFRPRPEDHNRPWRHPHHHRPPGHWRWDEPDRHHCDHTYDPIQSLDLESRPATTTSRRKSFLSLPDHTIILPNGSLQFPNRTVLLTSYTDDAVTPAARLPSGLVRFKNGTTISPDTLATFPPPGIPLDIVGSERLIDPPLLLPSGTVVFYNGSLWTPGLTRMETYFTRSISANCGGILCNHLRV